MIRVTFLQPKKLVEHLGATGPKVGGALAPPALWLPCPWLHNYLPYAIISRIALLHLVNNYSVNNMFQTGGAATAKVPLYKNAAKLNFNCQVHKRAPARQYMTPRYIIQQRNKIKMKFGTGCLQHGQFDTPF